MRTLSAMALAAVLALAGTQTALAATQNERGAIQADDENDRIAVAITAQIAMPERTNVPDTTFTFDVAPYAVDANIDDDPFCWPQTGYNDLCSPETLALPEIDPVSIHMTKSTAKVLGKDAATGVDTYYLESGDILANVVFPHAGVYVYWITERTDTNPGIDANRPHQNLSYSDAAYAMTVYVENRTQGTGTYVYAVAMADSTGRQAYWAPSDVKVDPTPGGNGTSPCSQLVFASTYWKTNGAVDPADPNPVAESTLDVSMIASGLLANRELQIRYEITLAVNSLVVDPPAFYKAYVVSSGVVVDPAPNADAGIIGHDDTDHGYGFIEVSTTAPTSFTLKSGQKLVVVNAPVGTRYVLTQATPTLYSPSYKVTTDSTVAPSVIGQKDTPVTLLPQVIGERVNAVAWDNQRAMVTLTGVASTGAPFLALIVLLVVAVAAFIVLSSRSRRRASR